jgi:hypothetical protein
MPRAAADGASFRAAGVLLLALLVVSPASSAQEFVWPLTLPRELTSSFAEYRSGRFHAGIDLRTGGIGKEVRAAGDGHVVRLRCSPWGYGKAVYLRLRDGYSVVYAHLDGFAEPLRSYVRDAQHARRSYTVDLQVEPGRLPVKAGDLIAYSGQTGVGAPHLHYEFRDAQERPINPRDIGLTWPDSTPPVFRKLLVAPAGPEASVAGDLVPRIMDARAAGPGRYVCDPVALSGTVGFGVDLVDHGPTTAYKLGIHRLRLRADGDEIFRIQHDRLSYDNLNDGVVAYHPYLLEQGRFLLLWRWPDNDCESYAATRSDGWWSVPQEGATIQIEAVDFLGNASVLEVPVVPAALPLDPPRTETSGGPGKVTLDCTGTWLTLTAAFPGIEGEAPRLSVDGAPSAQEVTFRRIDGKTFRAGYAPGRGGTVTLRVTHPRIPAYEKTVEVFRRDEAGRTARLDNGAEVRVGAGSPYGTLFLWSEDAGSASSGAGLRPVVPPLRIAPANAPIDAQVEVALPWPEDVERPGRVAVYRRGGGWGHEGGRREGNRMVVRTRGLGTFALMEDVAPPVIANVKPAEGATLQSRRPAISANVSDQGSGIADITATCGGQWLLMAYDPEHGRVTWERDADLPRGKQELIIRVTDNAGLEASVTRTITLP